MRTLAVIPARLGATRLPRKPLRLLAGLPLVVRVWQRVVEIGVAERVVVATDSDEVARRRREHGAEVVMTRRRAPSGTDRVAEVASTAGVRATSTSIVNVQGDEPFVSRAGARSARRAWSPTRASRWERPRSWRRREILDDPERRESRRRRRRPRDVFFAGANSVPARRDGRRVAARARLAAHRRLRVHAGRAACVGSRLPANPLEQIERLEQLRPLAAGMPIGVALIDEPVRPGIDTEEDLERANRDWTAFTTG